MRGIVSQRLVKSIDGGRVSAIEILLDSPRVKDLIHKAQISDLKEAMEKSTNFGMQTFDQSLYNLYKDGKITFDDAIKNADSANNLRLRVKLNEEGGIEKKEGVGVGAKPGSDSAKSTSDESELSLQIDSH